MTLERDKQAVRERVWQRLEDAGAVAGDAHGRIPDFVGSERTASMLADRPEWRRAEVVKANPDHAQSPIRVRALEDGKLLYVAVPKMATLEPFYVLDPDRLDDPHASVKVGAEGPVQRVGVTEMRPVDIVICGSVAVNRHGVRIGKGAGYSDLEVALLIEAGLVTDRTTIVAPVHGLQVLDVEIPRGDHDFTVDLIVTPTQVIECPRSPRPAGLIWRDLPQAKIDAIPVLQSMASSRARG